MRQLNRIREENNSRFVTRNIRVQVSYNVAAFVPNAPISIKQVIIIIGRSQSGHGVVALYAYINKVSTFGGNSIDLGRRTALYS